MLRDKTLFLTLTPADKWFPERMGPTMKCLPNAPPPIVSSYKIRQWPTPAHIRKPWQRVIRVNLRRRWWKRTPDFAFPEDFRSWSLDCETVAPILRSATNCQPANQTTTPTSDDSFPLLYSARKFSARRFYTSCSHTLSSASVVTTLWRYINLFKFKKTTKKN